MAMLRDFYNGDASFRPATTTSPLVESFSGGGGPDSMGEALKEYRSVMAPKAQVPLENYLGAVTSPESYRTAMMQYVANGGKKPNWYTGNYPTDKSNIEAAIAASMTPQQQLVRQESRERIAATKDQQAALGEWRKEEALRKEREAAAKRDQARPEKIVPGDKELEAAEDMLAVRLGLKDFKRLPLEKRRAAVREIASAAKLKMQTGETEGVDYDALVGAEVDQLIAENRLKPGKEGYTWLNIGGEEPSYTPRNPTPGEQATTLEKQATLPVVKGAPAPGTVKNGYRFKGGNPADRNSWEKI